MNKILVYFSLFLFVLSLTSAPSILYGNSEYEKWKTKEISQFRDFKEKRDKDFTAYLKKQWEEFRVFKGDKAYEKPKFTKIPIAPKVKPQAVKSFGGKVVKIKPLPQIAPKPIKKLKLSEAPKEEEKSLPHFVRVEPKKLKLSEKKEALPVKPVGEPEKKKLQVKIKPIEDPDLEEDLTLKIKPLSSAITEKETDFDDEPEPIRKVIEKPKELPKKTVISSHSPTVTSAPQTERYAKDSSARFEFYGTLITLRYDSAMKVIPMKKVDAKAISTFWEKQSKSDYENILKQLKFYRNSLSLNDWGYHLLVYKTGEKIFGQRDKNNIKLFSWFILSKSGFESKIGYNSNNVFLLIPSKNNLFGISFLNINGRKYYALSFDGKVTKMGSIFTYRAKYPGSEDLMDYGIYKTPEIEKKVKTKDLKFKYRGKPYSIPVKYNKSVADFFEYYPQTEFEVYFNASVSPEAGYSMIKGLRPIISGKTEGEAVNIIMRFVQTAFKYKTDNGQFGREKYLLPDETLFYPYSDCEDRSILFAYLVRSLLDLEVVGLHYPGHMATAVRFKDGIRGDFVTYKGKKYIVCDPTYVNADIGMAMPKYKRVNPKVIKIGV